MFDPPRILVTGGTGIIGQALVRKLVREGKSVRIISRNAKLAQHEKISIFRGDLTRLGDVRAAIQGCTAVFHCAAEKSDLRKMKDTNVTATRLLFDAAIDSGVKSFCHFSSAGIIGKTQQRVVDESSLCSPMNFYEETKLAAEQIVKRGLNGGNVVILRPTNIFGVQTLLPWLENSIYSKMRLSLIGNERAHLVYVEDVVAAAIFLWLAESGEGVETFNVSSDEEPGGTHRDVQTLFASTVKIASRQFAFSAPLFIPYCLRLMRNGVANHGNVIYSSRKLRAAGFRLPFGLQAGLIHAAGILRERTEDWSAAVR
jgi:nucleoside-diphosphate-sugar epimerase